MKFFDNSINLSNKSNKNNKSWTNSLLLKTAEEEPKKVLEGIVEKVRENKEPDMILQRQLDKDGYDFSRKNEKEFNTLEKSNNKGAKNIEVKYKEGTVETQLNENDTRNSEYYEAGLSLFTKEVYPKIKKRMEKNKEFYNRKENKDRLSKEDVVSAKSKSVNVKLSYNDYEDIHEDDQSNSDDDLNSNIIQLTMLFMSIHSFMQEEQFKRGFIAMSDYLVLAYHMGLIEENKIKEISSYVLFILDEDNNLKERQIKFSKLNELFNETSMEVMQQLEKKYKKPDLFRGMNALSGELSQLTTVNFGKFSLEKTAAIGEVFKNIFRPTDTMSFINRARKIVDYLIAESERYSFERSKDYGLEAIGEAIQEVANKLKRDISKISFGKNRDDLVGFVDALDYLEKFVSRYSKGYSFNISKHLDSLRDFLAITSRSLNQEIDTLRQRIHPIEKESNLFKKIYVDKKNPRDCSNNEKAFCYKDLESRESKQKTPTSFKKTTEE